MPVAPPPPVAVLAVSLSAAVDSDRTVLAGTFTLSAPVPAGTTLAVTLASDTAAVVVPATVTVAAGLTTGTFSITIGDLATPGTATIKASYSYSLATGTLALSPYHAPYVLDGTNALSTSLQALYLFCERTGTVLHDFSGKARRLM